MKHILISLSLLLPPVLITTGAGAGEATDALCPVDDYSLTGPYGVETEIIEGTVVYLPVGGCGSQRRFPLVVFSYGFGAGFADVAAPYNGIAGHLASMGYVVALNKDSSFTQYCSGEETVLAIRDKVSDHPLTAGLLADTWGAAGHSMGGATSGRLATARPEYEAPDAAVAIQPAYLNPVAPEDTGSKALTTTGLLAYQVLCLNKQKNATVKPTLFMSGDQQEWGEGENPQISFDLATGTAFLARLPTADHTLAPTVFIGQGANRSYLRATAAWFRWHLDGDEQAARLFTEGTLCDRDFTDCEGKGPDQD